MAEEWMDAAPHREQRMRRRSVPGVAYFVSRSVVVRGVSLRLILGWARRPDGGGVAGDGGPSAGVVPDVAAAVAVRRERDSAF